MYEVIVRSEEGEVQARGSALIWILFVAVA